MSEKITPDVKLASFQHWCGSQNYSETAKEIGISVASIHRIAEADSWAERYKKIYDRVLKKQETIITNKLSENLTKVRELKDKVLAELKAKKNINASITEIIKLFEYEDKIILRQRGVNVDQPIFQFTIHEKILSHYEMPNDANATEDAETTVQ